jgi:hypothetical protein
MLFVVKKKYFCFFSYLRTTYLYKHPVRSSLIDPHVLDRRFLTPLAMKFIFTSYL